MTTAILTSSSTPFLFKQRAPSTRRQVTTRSVAVDAAHWCQLARLPATKAAERLLYLNEQAELPRHPSLEGVVIAYQRGDHSQISMHHHDQVLPRQKPKASELDLVWVPNDTIDVELMERAGRPVSVTRDRSGKLCGMTPTNRQSLPLNRDLVRVMENTLGYVADSAGYWPLLISGSNLGSCTIVPASQRGYAMQHLLLGKERLRTIDLQPAQCGVLRPYEQLQRARLLGYDAALFREQIVSGNHGIQTIPAVALFPGSREKLSHLTIPMHPYDWPEQGPTSALTPEFLSWHAALPNQV